MPHRRGPHWVVSLSGAAFAMVMIALTAVLLDHLLLYTPREQQRIAERQTQILENQRKILTVLCRHSYPHKEEVDHCERLISDLPQEEKRPSGTDRP